MLNQLALLIGQFIMHLACTCIEAFALCVLV